VVLLFKGEGEAGPPVLVTSAEVPSRGRLLWLDGRPTVPGPGVVAGRDSTGRVLLVDDDLRIREAMLPGDIGSVVSAAPAGGGDLWVVDGQGGLRRVAEDGAVVANVTTPYAVPALGGVGDDGLLALARSTEGFPFVLDTAPEAPVALVNASGHPVERFGSAVRPEQVLVTDLANAGHVVRLGNRTVYAPFVRDEVVAFGPQGDTAWTFRRGLTHGTPDPKFAIRGGRSILDYFPVNLGLGPGPDGRLYVLSTADTTLERARLDVIEPASGRLLATLSVPTVFPTIVVTRRGEVHVMSSTGLLARAMEAARPVVPAFDWPRLDGSRATPADLAGRVTVVNVWASWCAPCREEMPALVALWRTLADSGLALLAVNENVRSEDARRWLRENDLHPPVVLAGGAARAVLGYPGLPYTLLVDREGRIVRKWIGYLGPGQIAAIGNAARRELGLAPVASDRAGGHDHGHADHNRP
jgi:cytochrome c biogenesis protein CcmG/thiol:disulfide interchange protein DsbE